MAKINNSSSYKSATRMHILILLPVFQNRVQEVRKAFDIHEGGFRSKGEVIEWLNKKGYGYHGIMPEGFYKEPPKNKFKDAIIDLGDDFNLPYNLIYSSFVGLADYILRNKISVLENNWEVFTELIQVGKKIRWVGIRSFVPLSKEEIREATKELVKVQKELIVSQITSRHRVKRNLEMDLEVLDFLASDIDKMSVKDIAEGLEISSDKVSKSLQRLSALSLELYGYPLPQIKQRKDVKRSR